jgi:uncharacterized membrane protein
MNLYYSYLVEESLQKVPHRLLELDQGPTQVQTNPAENFDLHVFPLYSTASPLVSAVLIGLLSVDLA